MKFSVKTSQVPNYQVFARRAGYALIYDRFSGQESFVRRLGSGYYPRLHLYIQERGDELQFSLHLDQKKTSYEGFSRHSAEYEDSELVEEEIKRLKALLGFRESISEPQNMEDLNKLFGLDNNNNRYEPF
jgi:hypothetical protein